MQGGNSRFNPFPTTRWSLILRVAGRDAEERNRALAEICGLYWPPIYAYIRNRGYPSHDAEDLTQTFFAHFLEQDHFSRPDSTRGLLRQYLLGSVKHFLASEHRRATRQKRGGAARPVSIDAGEGESRFLLLAASEELNPDRMFDRHWATTLLENVLNRLKERYRDRGREELFVGLSPFIRTDIAPPVQSEVAEELGMSAGTLRVEVHRLRQRYQKLLLDEIAATLDAGVDPAEELDHLKSVFAQS